MKDASVEGISEDLRFYTTFNALLALANTALRASGYRTTNQQGHHMRTIETLEYTIQADSKTIRKIMAFSKKRNVASYDSAGSSTFRSIMPRTTYQRCRGSSGLYGKCDLPLDAAESVSCISQSRSAYRDGGSSGDVGDYPTDLRLCSVGGCFGANRTTVHYQDRNSTSKSRLPMYCFS
jgi:hypothetical protein